jgi:hypothetical protein
MVPPTFLIWPPLRRWQKLGGSFQPDDSMTTMQRHALILLLSASLLSLAFRCAHAASAEFTSPNGAVRFQLATDGEGRLSYSVTAHGQPRLAPARAGIVVDDRDLGAGVDLGPATTRRIAETFPWRGNKTLATNHCHAAEVVVRPRRRRSRMDDRSARVRRRCRLPLSRARHWSATGERRTHRLAPSPGHRGLAADEYGRL